MMEKKIRGVEQELAMNCQPSLPPRSLVHLVGMAVEELKREGLVTGIKVEEEPFDYMALNGFRVYNDMGHLELSSPSYNSPMEAVVYDKVAELFSYYAVRNLKGYFREINVYKNNVSNVKEDGGWTAVCYSTHHSILMNRATCNLDVWDKVEEALIPFVVARVPLIGSGDFAPRTTGGGFSRPGKYMSGDEVRYAISPRALFIRRLSTNDTVDARGLLNQRDDPHADPAKYWRLHDINFEGLRSPYQIYLRDCLETLVMTAYDGGYLKNPPRLADPVSAIKEVSADVEACDWKVSLEGGERVDAVSDIMEGYYLAAIEEMMGDGSPTDVDRMGFNLIKATLGGLGERRLEYFVDGLDWVTKKALIDEYAPGNTEEAMGICNQYFLIDDSVLGYIGEDPGDFVHTTFDYEGSLQFARDAIPLEDWDTLGSLIKVALTSGPSGTRDYIRCLVAREFPNFVESIEWERISFPNFRITLEEPFKFNREMCGDVLEESTETLASFMRAIRQLDRENDLVVQVPTDDHEKEKVEGGGDL